MSEWEYEKYYLEVSGYAEDFFRYQMPNFSAMLSKFRKSGEYKRHTPLKYQDFLWEYLDGKVGEGMPIEGINYIDR